MTGSDLWREAWQRVEPGATTTRGRAKAERRRALLDAAARLFAERGFNGVSIDEIGQAAGVSGPAVYRHFATKQEVLAKLLVGVSTALADGGERVVTDASDDEDALRGLIGFHTAFATAESDVIRVQDRDLATLDDPAASRVRELQRAYIALWARVLARVRDDLTPREARLRVRAAFGLLNSTPHSTRALGAASGSAGRTLGRMAWAALTV